MKKTMIFLSLLIGFTGQAQTQFSGFGDNEQIARSMAEMLVWGHCMSVSNGTQVPDTIIFAPAREGNSCEIGQSQECRDGFIVDVDHFRCG